MHHSTRMLYPLLFEPIYKERVWGGERLRALPQEGAVGARIGERWDISCREAEMGIIENGIHTGRRFSDVINQDRAAYLGTNLAEIPNFPLLVKIIDANDALSVQVHPDGADGKSEMWYVMDAEPDASLILGLREGVSKDDFARAIREGTLEGCLNHIPIAPGDIIDIPAGVIHAIGKGIMLAEIQQNSDTTYRVYDYNRPGLDGKPRELHIQRALDVTDFEYRPSKWAPSTLGDPIKGNRVDVCVKNPHFIVEKQELKEAFADRTDPRYFSVLTCVRGCFTVHGDGFAPVKMDPSRSLFLPAGLGSYHLSGSGVLLKSSPV